MQLMVLSIPAGETLGSLSYVIDGEVLIGRGHRCQIILPDRQQSIAECHIRIFRDDNQWYLENMSSGELMVNTTPIQPRQSRHHLLSDGDMIYCGNYCLMASDFSPWQRDGMVSLATKQTDLALENNGLVSDPQSWDFEGPLPAEDTVSVEEASRTEHLDDPFLPPEAQRQESSLSIGPDGPELQIESPFSDFDVYTADAAPVSCHPVPLIDVLASDDEESEWSINRNLRMLPVPQAEAIEQAPPNLTGAEPSEPHQPELSQAEAWQLSELMQQPAVLDAILAAVDSMMADFCPDNLEQLLSPMNYRQEPASGSAKETSETACADFWQQYQNFYRCLMHGRHYQALFLQRLKEAVNR
ncbi:FHA domain-containing protein [Endozoicomonas acroporae]|uniref:FHA domain-containing protein n=1 Tax=Endozoicomonas acroporae TaxID=1701104 RepID=UPI003D7AE762